MGLWEERDCQVRYGGYSTSSYFRYRGGSGSGTGWRRSTPRAPWRRAWAGERCLGWAIGGGRDSRPSGRRPKGGYREKGIPEAGGRKTYEDAVDHDGGTHGQQTINGHRTSVGASVVELQVSGSSNVQMSLGSCQGVPGATRPAVDGKTPAEANNDLWGQSPVKWACGGWDQPGQETTSIDVANSKGTNTGVAYGAAARWRRASTATAETGRIEIPPDGQLQPGGIGEDKGVAQAVYSRDGKPILCS